MPGEGLGVLFHSLIQASLLTFNLPPFPCCPLLHDLPLPISHSFPLFYQGPFPEVPLL